MISLIDKKISNLAKGLSLEAPVFLPAPLELRAGFNDTLPGKPDARLMIGDNLSYLRGLVIHSSKAVDICYIDPPYNTGSKFIYQDNRKSNNHILFGSHAAWMSFMLPRIYYARELLKSTGIIAISIDDYEYTYLKLLMDRVFGEQNFIGNIVVCRSKNGKGSRKNVATNHEYLLIYGNSSEASLNGEQDQSQYPKEDEYGRFRTDGLFRKKGDASLKADRPNMHYPLYYDGKTGRVSVDPVDGWEVAFPKDSKGVERRWLWVKETARERQWQLFASKNGVIYVKNYAGEANAQKRRKIRTIWSDTNFYTERATNELTGMFGSKVFDTPKPIDFIKKVIDICGDNDSLILDFFAGSATTAQAAYELNKVDLGSRKCILMETDSPIPENHAASEAGFKRISDISVARLKKIKESDENYSFDSCSIDEAEKNSRSAFSD
ncbi:MAG: site-specific DNA-methyltransferase [Aestuariibacter sp.]